MYMDEIDPESGDAMDALLSNAAQMLGTHRTACIVDAALVYCVRSVEFWWLCGCATMSHLN